MPNRLKERRLQLGLSAEDVADAVGSSRATIFRWEKLPDLSGLKEKTIRSLSEVLNTTRAFLLEYTDDPLDYDEVLCTVDVSKFLGPRGDPEEAYRRYEAYEAIRYMEAHDIPIPRFISRLQELRLAREWSQTGLAANLGVPLSVVQAWESGKEEPDETMVRRIARLFGTTVEDLGLGTEQIPADRASPSAPASAGLSNADHEHLRKLHALDHYGKRAVEGVLDLEYERCTREAAKSTAVQPLTRPIRFVPLPVSAGTGVTLTDEQTEAIDIPLTPESRQADFVLKVAGDSMEPEYHDGDLLLIQQTDIVELGEFGVFSVNNEGVFKRRGYKQLESLNPKYKPIKLNEWDDVTTFGRVLGSIEPIGNEPETADEEDDTVSVAQVMEALEQAFGPNAKVKYRK